MNVHKKIRSFEKFPRFFKVYLLELSSERMKIPNVFIARIGIVLPDKVILRISPGRIWHVKVIKEENDMFFGKGWKEFAKHNSVEHGDFLVFKYNGGNVFDVKLFGKSECEKTERDEVEEILIEVEEDVEEAEEECCDHDYDDKSEDDYDYNQEEEEEGTEEEKVEVEEESESESEDCYDESDHDYDYNEEEEDTEENKVEVVEEEDDDEEEAKSSRKRRGKKNIGEFKAHAGLTVGGGEGSAYLRNPHFFTRVRMWLEHLLFVPKNWMKHHKITLQGKVTYLGPQGRQWSGTVHEWTDGRIFIDGWADFCKANNIRLNDRCICELLPDQRGNVLRVRMVPN